MNKAPRALILFTCALWVGGPALARGTDGDPVVSEASVWRPFRSPEGRFSILFPGAPVVTSSERGTILGPVRGKRYAVEMGGTRVTVAFHDLPRIAIFLLTSGAILDRARESFLEDVGGRMIDSRSTTHDGFPAREVHYTRPDPASPEERALFVLVEGRLYLAIATEPGPPEARAVEVLQSFETRRP